MSITKATRSPISVCALLWLSVPAQAEALFGNDLSPQIAVFEKSDGGAVYSSLAALTRRQAEIDRIGRPLGAEGGF